VAAAMDALGEGGRGKGERPTNVPEQSSKCAGSTQKPLLQPEGRWWSGGEMGEISCRRAEWDEGLRTGEELKLGAVKKNGSEEPGSCPQPSGDKGVGNRRGSQRVQGQGQLGDAWEETLASPSLALSIGLELFCWCQHESLLRARKRILHHFKLPA